jgi:8-oxo-dGTP pyrophosphatase MutT (NUDIX family)
MDKFSKVKAEEVRPEEKVLFESGNTKIVDYEGWAVLNEPDTVVCIPYLIEYNQFIIRQEYIPSFKLAEGKDFHITVVAGGIENNETPEQALRRELEEEAGIVLRENFQFEFERPLFKTKSGSSAYHFCIVPLTESDYHEVIPKGDGSEAEAVSKSVKVSVKNLNAIIPSDTITELMIQRLRKYLNV